MIYAARDKKRSRERFERWASCGMGCGGGGIFRGVQGERGLL